MCPAPECAACTVQPGSPSRGTDVCIVARLSLDLGRQRPPRDAVSTRGLGSSGPRAAGCQGAAAPLGRASAQLPCTEGRPGQREAPAGWAPAVTSPAPPLPCRPRLGLLHPGRVHLPELLRHPPQHPAGQQGQVRPPGRLGGGPSGGMAGGGGCSGRLGPQPGPRRPLHPWCSRLQGWACGP